MKTHPPTILSHARQCTAALPMGFDGVPRRPLRRQGFTLMEVLVAIGIFTVGMVAVASIFPVAILLQKETVYTVESQQFARNAKAMIETIGFTDDAVDWDALENDGIAGTGPDFVVPLLTDAFDSWSIEDRSYNAIDDIAGRNVFWVPLVYDSDPTPDAYAWRIYLFVVRGRTTETYDKSTTPAPVLEWADVNATTRDPATSPAVPGVCRINVDASAGLNPTYGGYEMAFDNDPRIIFPGNQVVDANGIVYTIRAATDTAIYVDGIVPGLPNSLDIWAAHPGDGTTTTFVKLITLLEESPDTLIRKP